MPLSGILGQLGAAPSGAPAPSSGGSGLSGMLGSLASTRTSAASADMPDAAPTISKRPPAPTPQGGLSLPNPLDVGTSETTPQVGGKPLTFGDVLGGLKAIPGLAWDAVSAIPKALVNSELHPSAEEQGVEQAAMSHPADTFGKIAQALPNAGTAAAFRFFQPMFQPYADDLSQSLVAPEFTNKVAKGEMKYSDLEQAFPVLQKSNAQVVADSVIAGLSAYMPGFFGESVSKAATLGGIDALKQGAASGVMAGGLFAGAQVVSSGTKDPGEIGKIFSENLVGGALLGGLVHSTIPLSKEAFTAATKDIEKTYGIPQNVYISPQKVRDVFQTGTLATERENDLLRSLGLTGDQWRQAIKEGVSIEIPARNVTTITDKPYWAQIKDTFGFQPTNTTIRAEAVPQMSERIMNPSRQLPSPEDIKARIAAGRTPEEVTHELAQDVPFTEAQKAVEEAQNTPEPVQEPAKPGAENAVEQTAPVGELDKTPGMIQQELGTAQTAHETEQAALQKQLTDLQAQVKAAPAQSAEKKALKVEVASVKAKLDTGQQAHQDAIAGKGGAFADTVGSHIQETHGLPPEQAAMLAGKVAEHVASPTEETRTMPIRDIAARVVAEHKTAQLYSEGETVVMKGAGSSFPDGEYKITSRLRTPSDTKYELTGKNRKPVWTNQQMLDTHGSRKTQAQKVKEVVAKKGSAKAGEVAKETGILEPNVRRILGVGAKQGEFERVGEGVYKVNTPDGKDVAFVIPGDALKELPRLAKEGFKADMVFLDIPYKTKALTGGNRGIKDYEFITPADFNHVLRSVSQIVQGDHSSVFYMFSQAKSGQKEMDVYTSLFETNGFKPVARGEWTKLFKNGGRATNPRGDIQAPEGIIMFNKSGEMPEGKEAPSLAFKLVRPKGYQTEKPAELLKALIEMSTKEGETVLDPFAGSGVTIEQAVKTGRKAVGIEKKDGQAEKAAARAQAAVSKPKQIEGVPQVISFTPSKVAESKTPETPEAAAEDYWKNVIAPAMKAGKPVIIGADDMKDYFGNDYNDANHKIYSRAAYLMYERALKENPGDVVLTGGGAGSGKTEILVKQMGGTGFKGIVYDSNMANYDGVVKQILLATDAGREVRIFGITPKLESARTFTIQRGNETGRKISDATFARGHAGFPDVAARLIENGVVRPEQVYILDTRDVPNDLEKAIEKFSTGGFVKDPLAYLRGLGYSEANVKAEHSESLYDQTTGRRLQGAKIRDGGSESPREGGSNKEGRANEGLRPVRTAGDTKLTVPRAKSALSGTNIYEGTTPDGRDFVTNSYILQFGDTPSGVEPTGEREGIGTAVEKLSNEVKDAKPLSPPDRFSTDFVATTLYLKLPDGEDVGLNSIYYNYFLNAFKGAELRGTGSIQPVGVFKDDELVGFIMPMMRHERSVIHPLVSKTSGGKDFSMVPDDLKPAAESTEQDNSLLSQSETKYVRYSGDGRENTDALRGGTWYTKGESQSYKYNKESTIARGLGGTNRSETTLDIQHPLTLSHDALDDGSFALADEDKLNLLPEEQASAARTLQIHRQQQIDPENFPEEEPFTTEEAVRQALEENGTPEDEIRSVLKARQSLDVAMDLVVSKGLRENGYDALVVNNAHGEQFVFKLPTAASKDFSSLPENKSLEKVPRTPKNETPSAEEPKTELDPRELYNAERAIEQNHPRGFVGTVFKETATLFNPRGQVQTPALDVIMRNKGEYERTMFRTERAMKEVKKMWDAHAQEVGLDFMDKVETGRIRELPPAFRALAEMYRLRLDNAYRAISEFKDVPFLENYFPHLWKDPKAVAESNLWAKANARRPLQGSKSFMKHRIFATIQDGIKAGFELATHNPEELMQLHEQNIQKFLMANRIMQDLKARGFTKFVPVGSKGRPPEGFARLNDAISKVYLNPHIPILEAYDEHVYNALASVIEELGLEHDRKYDIGARGALGFTRDGTDKITTKFGSPLSVIAHELGHQLDYKYGLKELFRADPDRTYGSETDYSQRELRALADLRYEGHDVTDSYKQYVRSAPEKMAVMLEALVHAPEKFKEVAPRTYEKFTAFLRSHKETAPLLDVKPGLVYGVREDSIYAGGLVIGGEHWVQKDVARLLNNYLSPDHLMDTAIGRGVMNVKNSMNALELGFSAFHLTMETLDTMITKFGIGLTKVVHGDFNGFKDMAVSPTAPFTYFRAGQKFFNGDQELMKIEKDLFTGGASLRQKQYYKNTVFDRFMTTNREIVAMVRNSSYDATKSVPESVLKPESKLKKAPAIVKAIAQNTLRIPMAVVEATMRPLFTYYIPRLKVGAFRDLFAAELERNSQRIQDGEMTRESIARDVWNNIENRMGELNYDNLFWDRNLKTGLMLTTRAVGWNLGTAREIGGALFQDIPREAGKAARGKGFNFTSKMGYTFSLFFFVATIGAIYQYLHTGKKPQSVKDLYYPRNGATTAAGEPYRVEFPTYLKDIYQSGVPQLLTGNPFGAFDSFTSMLKNKSAPELSAILDTMNNRDFYGNEIRNPNDNAPTQAKQLTLYLLSTLTPFTIQQQQNLAAGKSNIEQQAEAFLGIIRAPKAVIQSDYNAQLEALYQDQQGLHAPETPEQQDAYNKKQVVVDQIKKGDYSGVQGLVTAGIVKPSGLRSFIQNAVLTTPQKEYRYLSPENKAKAQKLK